MMFPGGACRCDHRSASTCADKRARCGGNADIDVGVAELNESRQWHSSLMQKKLEAEVFMVTARDEVRFS